MLNLTELIECTSFSFELNISNEEIQLRNNLMT